MVKHFFWHQVWYVTLLIHILHRGKGFYFGMWSHILSGMCSDISAVKSDMCSRIKPDMCPDMCSDTFSDTSSVSKPVICSDMCFDV